jgi:hypothetical protein
MEKVAYPTAPYLYLQSRIIHRTRSAMRFFGIQIGLLQVALQTWYQIFLQQPYSNRNGRR